MGLDQPKSLIRVKGEDTFLDFIARQVSALRGTRRQPAFYLMNSFVTQEASLTYLRKYPDLADATGSLDFLQSMVPKIDAKTYEPVSWPSQPDLEWCPPGHGDLYPALHGCGLLERLVQSGVIYAFVSNSDNLGATVDLTLLKHFADSGWSFLMEVAERTAADRKGGHLARNRANGRLLLRESAQCPKADEAQFQDISRHRYFNTNNLWIRLDHLQQALLQNQGSLPLPLITNAKSVDPKNPESPQTLQLESAMGAAIECFARTGAVVVPRTRFSPVKSTADLLALRSDAYSVTPDSRLVLDPARQGQPPLIDLDPRYYKVLESFDALFPAGPPSLLKCHSLKISGPVRFSAQVRCEGTVELVTSSADPRQLPAGLYANQRSDL